ncbi:unnamed protein product [Urochloa humidicola]
MSSWLEEAGEKKPKQHGSTPVDSPYQICLSHSPCQKLCTCLKHGACVELGEPKLSINWTIGISRRERVM